MLDPFRTTFNTEQFTPARYADLQAKLNARCRTDIQFRIAETPCFFPVELLQEMSVIGRALTHQLIDSADYMRLSDAAIPDAWRFAHDNPRPNFMTVDFGLVREEGVLKPKLVELQAFPSIFGFQDAMSEQYVESYGLSDELRWHFGGLDQAGYWRLLGRTLLNGHDPEQVILMEVTPAEQKTLPDFHVYEDRLGIRTVDITHIRQTGRQLEYQRDGRWVPIRRIFNRAIVDELERKGITPGHGLQFDPRADLNVEWAGHPNWYFRVSKFSLPYLDHPSVPTAVFLDDWFRGERRGLPDDREQLLLKPLYSFAGKGIQFAPTDADLRAIPEAERRNYLLQQRVHFEPVIRTPHGDTQAEVRIMYLWPEGQAEMRPAVSLVRLGRGLMMGVDHNRDQEWVGGSSAMFPATP